MNRDKATVLAVHIEAIKRILLVGSVAISGYCYNFKAIGRRINGGPSFFSEKPQAVVLGQRFLLRCPGGGTSPPP